MELSDCSSLVLPGLPRFQIRQVARDDNRVPAGKYPNVIKIAKNGKKFAEKG